MAKRIAVVVSQGQSQNPIKRQLEEELITRLMFQPGVDVTVIPHLYDLRSEGTGVLALQGIKGDLIVVSWLFSRAARWVLDRLGVYGQEGITTLVSDDEEEEDEEDVVDRQDRKTRVVDRRDQPARRIWCLDLKVRDSVEPFFDEIVRIASESTVKTVDLMGWLQGTPNADVLDRYVKADNNPKPLVSPTTEHSPPMLQRIEEGGEQRRWYPVIDYSRCTNCMECIDFCLFGVYGVDRAETILVEQPDNCRKGCPACSRVCPENAIMFPQHKTPAIAGADSLAASLKIDLSKLFGAPESGKSAVELAVLERDEQLLAAGRDAVGMSVGMSATGTHSEPEQVVEEKTSASRDEFDDLLDELDRAAL